MCCFDRSKLSLLIFSLGLLFTSACNNSVMEPDEMDENDGIGSELSIVDHICEADNTVANLNNLSENTRWVPIKYWNYLNRSNLDHNTLYLGDNLEYSILRAGNLGGYNDMLDANYKINENENTITLESINGTFQNEELQILHYDSLLLMLYSNNLCSDTCLFINNDYLDQYLGDICTQASQNTELQRYGYCNDCDFGFRGPNCFDQFIVTQESFPNGSHGSIHGGYYYAHISTYVSKVEPLSGRKQWESSLDEFFGNFRFVDNLGFLGVENVRSEDMKYKISTLLFNGEIEEDIVDLPIEVAQDGYTVPGYNIDGEGNVYELKRNVFNGTAELYSVNAFTQGLNWTVNVDVKYNITSQDDKFIMDDDYLLLTDNESFHLILDRSTGFEIAEFDFKDINSSDEELINILVSDETIYMITEEQTNGIPNPAVFLKAYDFNLNLKWSRNLYSLLIDFDYHSLRASELRMKSTESYLIVYRKDAEYEGEIHVMSFEKNGKLLHNSQIKLSQLSSTKLDRINDVIEKDGKLFISAQLANSKVVFINLAIENTYKPFSSCLE